LYQDFNPFEDFLKKIRPSGKNSTVEQLFEYFTFDDNVPLDWAISMMKKHLIRSVGCGLGKIINREVIVFAGQTENIGKTEFVRWLHPFEDMAYYTSMALGKDKESMMRLTENITYLMEEMSNTNAAQLSYIKAVISNDIVDSRQLYKEYSDLYKRRANFYGTTNHPYLPATEQNTRFVTIPILNIDWEGYTQNICLTDLWYTAYQDFLQGVDYKISDEERAIQKAINLDWIKFENTFALTREYVVPLSAPYSEKECLSVVSIMEKISMITNAAKGYDFNFYTVEAALRKLGIMRTKVSAGNYVYACRIKTVEELYSVSNQSNQYAKNG
jgi:predicted P-loop ATPase